MQVQCLVRFSTNKEFYYPSETVDCSLQFYACEIPENQLHQYTNYKKTNLPLLYNKVFQQLDIEQNKRKYYTVLPQLEKGDLKVDSIILQFFGSVNCNPSWVSFPRENHSNIIKTSSSTYLVCKSDVKNVVLDSKIPKKNCHTLNFAFKTPQQSVCVPSYVGKIASVAYCLTCELFVSDFKGKQRKVLMKIPIVIKNPSSSLRKVFPNSREVDVKWNFTKENKAIVPKQSDDFDNILYKIQKDRKTQKYLINKKEVTIGTVILNTLTYSLKDNIIIELKMNREQKEYKCVNLEIFLVVYEEVNEKCLKIEIEKFKSVAKQVIYHTKKNMEIVMETGFIIPLQSERTASFKSDVLDLNWSLEFVFSLRKEYKIEELKWKLPLTVFDDYTIDGYYTHEKKQIFELF